jgi:hypothetical protein
VVSAAAVSAGALSRAPSRTYRTYRGPPMVSRAARQANPDGLGLGLPIAAAIAAAHDAGLTARPRPDGGLITDVTYPAGDR